MRQTTGKWRHQYMLKYGEEYRPAWNAFIERCRRQNLRPVDVIMELIDGWLDGKLMLDCESKENSHGN